MSQLERADFLVEIGTEELPPKAMRSLMTAFADNLRGAVDAARLDHGALHAYASPRRLGVLIEGLAARQEDRTSTQKGPPVAIAYDEEGNLTAAGAAFARKCGVDESALGRTGSDKGEWLSCEVTEAGAAADTLLPELVDKALSSLPIPRRMRWGAGEAEFVRPVHWVVMLHGSGVVDATILGIRSGNSTRGHRFHSEGPITIAAPSAYLETLEREGRVIADFERRRELVRDGVEAQAKAAGGHAVGSEELYDEVAALVEWPVPITGSFDDEYLRLPREVVVSTLAGHQRYFPVADADGALLPRFITVANLESKDPDQVRDGNERVIRPRLADAAFFWESDRRTTLAARREALREVVYQRGLGSLFDKSARTASLCAQLAADLEIDGGNAERAAALCKCDLLTGMVGEFPELQGTICGDRRRDCGGCRGDRRPLPATLRRRYPAGRPRRPGTGGRGQGRYARRRVFDRQASNRQSRSFRPPPCRPGHRANFDRVRAGLRSERPHCRGRGGAARGQV
jgi:glycyl-tRNA synthetase beta chain